METVIQDDSFHFLVSSLPFLPTERLSFRVNQIYETIQGFGRNEMEVLSGAFFFKQFYAISKESWDNGKLIFINKI